MEALSCSSPWEVISIPSTPPFLLPLWSLASSLLYTPPPSSLLLLLSFYSLTFLIPHFPHLLPLTSSSSSSPSSLTSLTLTSIIAYLPHLYLHLPYLLTSFTLSSLTVSHPHHPHIPHSYLPRCSPLSFFTFFALSCLVPEPQTLFFHHSAASFPPLHSHPPMTVQMKTQICAAGLRDN